MGNTKFLLNSHTKFYHSLKIVINQCLSLSQWEFLSIFSPSTLGSTACSKTLVLLFLLQSRSKKRSKDSNKVLFIDDRCSQAWVYSLYFFLMFTKCVCCPPLSCFFFFIAYFKRMVPRSKEDFWFLFGSRSSYCSQIYSCSRSM